MAIETFTVQSIFDGIMPTALFGGPGQYLAAIGIDPDMPITDDSSDTKPGGVIRPVSYAAFSSTEIDAAPIAIINEPKSDVTWAILSNGKVVAYPTALTAATASSIGQVTGSVARGAFYYNNFIYITGTGSSGTDVSRVGPLNTLPYDTQTGNFTAGLTVTGATSGATGKIVSDVDGGASGTLTLEQITGIFADNEVISDTGGGSAAVNRTFASLITNGLWTGATLGSLTALTNTNYPQTLFSLGYLNHHGITHIDGAAYFLDYKQGTGYVHKIKTSRTTNEGDTNNGSAYGVLDLPINAIPITIEKNGSDLAVGCTFTSSGTIVQGAATLFLWDTTSDSNYRAVPLPGSICSALKYENGELRGISGDIAGGYYLWRYVGGDAVEVLQTITDGKPPLQNAITSVGTRTVWGANLTYPMIASGLFAHGSLGNPKSLHMIAVSGFT